MAYNNPYIGEQIGNYRILKEIARGGFGSVYLAQHLILTERLVVIKLLHQIFLGSPQERDDFIQEARILEKLKHPHILPILDVGIYSQIPYLITEYAQKGSLRARLKQQGGQPLAIDEALIILTQVGEALQHAHQQHIIHRDLKPENILFNAQGEVLLADFGVATILTTASVAITGIVGTPAYMSPEQFRGKVSKESDQYALGCIAYELYTGRPPFYAPDFVSMGFKHATELPIFPRQFNATLPEQMERAILTALAKEREARYPSIMAFIAALQAASIPEYASPTVAVPVHSLAPVTQAPVVAPPDRQTPLVLPSLPNEQATPLPPPLPAQQRQQQQFQLPATPAATSAAGQSEGITKKMRRVAGWSYLVPLLEVFFVVINPFGPVLVHLLAFLIALIFLRKRSRFIRFHIMQSLHFFLVVNVGGLILAVLTAVFYNWQLGGVSGAKSIFDTLVSFNWLVSIIAVVLLIAATIAAFRGKYFKIPFIGKRAERFADKKTSQR